MRIRMTRSAIKDVLDAGRFYETRQVGLERYFKQCIIEDIGSLASFAGIHRKAAHDFHRVLMKRFPFFVYYRVRGELVIVAAVIDCRRNPELIDSLLRARQRMKR